MASSSSNRNSAASDSYSLDNIASRSSSASALYRDSSSYYEDEDLSDYMSERTRRTYVGRALYALGVPLNQHARTQSGEYEHFSLPRDGQHLPGGVLKAFSQSRSPGRGRRGRRGNLVKKVAIAVPVAMLAILGILHIMQSVQTQTSLFWPIFHEPGSDPFEEYLEHLNDEPSPPGWDASLSQYPTSMTRDIHPIPCHSHNDYWRRIPLFSALHYGFTSVEADVWLFDGGLYVGHTANSLTRNRTLANLYVDPLIQLLESMNPTRPEDLPFNANTSLNGIFDTDPTQTLTLLIDFKTAPNDTYNAVSDALEPLRVRDWLTYFDISTQTLHPRPIKVVATGNTPFARILAEPTRRDLFFDAPLDRFSSATDPNTSTSSLLLNTLLPLSSQGQIIPAATPLSAFNASTSHYASTSFMRSIGLLSPFHYFHLSSSQRSRMRAQIQAAHAQGLVVRYWDTPAWPRSWREYIWRELLREGADVLNADDLRAAAKEVWGWKEHGRRGHVRERWRW